MPSDLQQFRHSNPEKHSHWVTQAQTLKACTAKHKGNVLLRRKLRPERVWPTVGEMSAELLSDAA